MKRSILTWTALALFMGLATAHLASAQNILLSVHGGACQPHFGSTNSNLQYGPEGVVNTNAQNYASVQCPISPLPGTGVDSISAVVYWATDDTDDEIFCGLVGTDYLGETLASVTQSRFDGEPLGGLVVGGPGIQQFSGALVWCDLPPGARLATLAVVYDE